MNLQNVSITLSQFELKELIKTAVKAEFPNHMVDKITFESNGDTTVTIKKIVPYSYNDR